MSLKITHKYSTAAGTPPASGDIDVGEIAINAADAELYTKDNAGNIRKFQNTTTGTADGMNFTQAGTGAVQRTVESKLQDVVSVLDFIPKSEHTAIKDNTSTYDCTADIQAALVATGSVYFPAGKYIVKSTVNLSSAVGGVTQKPRIIGAGGTDGVTTIISYEPTTPGGAAFRVSAGGAHLIGFKLLGPGNDTGTNEIGIDFRKVDGTSGGSQQGTLLEDLLIDDFDTAGVYIGGQWLMQINLSRFIRCGNRASIADYSGGIAFDPTKTSLANWSSSGVTISDCYFASCSYGIFAASAWNLITQNCIFEYCTTPYWRSASGNLHLMANPWFEGNDAAPNINGGMFIIGGRAVDLSNANPYGNSAVYHLTSDKLSIVNAASEQAALNYTGNLSFANGRGLDYSATAGAGASSSLLNDYEEGAWTPVLTDGTNDATFTAIACRYTKVGRLIYVRGTILNVDTTDMTAGASLLLRGLPYASQPNTANANLAFPMGTSGVTTTKGIAARLGNNDTQMIFYEADDIQGTTLKVSGVTSGSADLFISIAYEAA